MMVTSYAEIEDIGNVQVAEDAPKTHRLSNAIVVAVVVSKVATLVLYAREKWSQHKTLRDVYCGLQDGCQRKADSLNQLVVNSKCLKPNIHMSQILLVQ